MGLKKTKAERVGVTLYFDGNRFVAKLVKRVTGRRYADAASVVEAAFQEVFGTFQHVSGTTTWAKGAADPDMADDVARRLNMHNETLSVTYNRPPTVTIPTPKKASPARANKAAILVLQRSISGDGLALGINGEIDDARKNINNYQKRLQDEQNALEGLIAKREQIMESIKSLGG